MFDVSDSQKIGVGLTGFGALFLLLGVLTFFDRALLAMGNVMFLAGVVMLIGISKTFAFFFRPGKLRGASTFLGGIVLVLIGYPVVGMAIELFGFINLFGDFFPTIVQFLRRMPIIGNILCMPVISDIIDRALGIRELPV
eukprot:CFRG2350T1